MTRLNPTGPKHDRCVEHVEHSYPVKGVLCIGPSIGRAGMIAFADEMAAKAADHRAMFLAMPAPIVTAKARKAVRPFRPLVSKLNDGMVDHRCPATAEHGNRIRASFLVPGSRGRYGCCAACAIDVPTRPYGLIGPYVEEMQPIPTVPAAAFVPMNATESSLAELVARFAAMRGKPAPDTYAAAIVRKPRKIAPVRPPVVGPVQVVIDGAVVAETRRVDLMSPVEPEPEPVQEPAPRPAPVLVASQPARPTCERCGQSFRKSGAGAEWHRVNRPDCASRRLSVVA
jgi:hypothetical protein